jgi:hypothetical protein
MTVDFDALARDAEAEGNPEKHLHALARAIFSLSHWHFIARGEASRPNPFIASHAGTAGGIPMVRAFTDTTRLGRFAEEHGLVEERGIRVMSVPLSEGDVVAWLEHYIPLGAEGLWFNSDAESHGFFFPLRALRGIRDAAHGVVAAEPSEPA